MFAYGLVRGNDTNGRAEVRGKENENNMNKPVSGISILISLSNSVLKQTMVGRGGDRVIEVVKFKVRVKKLNGY